MARKSQNRMISSGVIARNKKAYFNYEISGEIEAGIQLVGGEAKSLRLGQGNISESFAVEKDGELFLSNSYIAEYQGGKVGFFETRRPRKLLLRKKQINELIGKITKDGVTVIPLELYFNEKGIAKVKIGIGTGKKKYDKRQAIAERDWTRDKARILKNGNE